MRSTYDDIWNRGSELILSGNSEPDSQIDDPGDSRRGMTLIFRPSQSVLDKFVDQIDPFAVNYKGITASASCVMAQGFLVDDTLGELRALLRTTFGNSTLEHSIDERYAIAIAHSTLIRFRNRLSRPQEFLELLSRFRSVEWGQQDVFELELVLNDWYHKSSRVEEIAKFRVLNY